MLFRSGLVRIFIVVLPCVRWQNARERLRKEIVSCMKKEMRPEIEYRVEYVRTIPPDPSGKLGIISTKIKHPEKLNRTSE